MLKNRDNKFIGLELARGISAIAVLVWHYGHFQSHGSQSLISLRSDQPFYWLFWPFYEFGYYGVQVFWCISGFIFFMKYGDVIRQKKITGFQFFLLRFTRLYPLHLVTLLCVAALQAIYFAQSGKYFIYTDNSLPSFFRQLFFASDWGFKHPYSFNGPIWSVSVEVLVYVIFFINVLCLGNSLALRLFFVAGALMLKKLVPELPVLSCLAFFYLGGVVFWLHDWPIRSNGNRRIGIGLLGLPALVVGVVAWLNLFPHVDFKNLVLLTAVPAALLILAAWQPHEGLICQGIKGLGNLTYASYLCHFPLQLVIVIAFDAAGMSLPILRPEFFLAYLSISLIVAYFVYHWFEMPMQDALRRHWAGSAAR